MRVSVIIPVYNKERYIGRCLQSLARQNLKNLEIIVVDDGSEKSSKLKAQSSKLLKKLNYQFLRQAHKGPAMARNLGAKYARGEILVFVDVDMTFDKDFVEDLIQPIELGKAKGTFSKEEYVANWRNIWARCWNYNLGLKDKKKIAPDYPDKAPVFRAILKSEFLRAGGFEPVGYADDWTLSKKLGYKAYAAPDAVYFHYNPETLREVFFQAKWRAKREYKWGLLGDLLTLVSFIFPVSLLTSFIKAVQFNEPKFLIFKIVFDFGFFFGLLEKLLFKNFY